MEPIGTCQRTEEKKDREKKERSCRQKRTIELRILVRKSILDTDLVRRWLDPVERQILVKRLRPGLRKSLRHAVHVIVIRSLIGICKRKRNMTLRN